MLADLDGCRPHIALGKDLGFVVQLKRWATAWLAARLSGQEGVLAQPT